MRKRPADLRAQRDTPSRPFQCGPHDIEGTRSPCRDFVKRRVRRFSRSPSRIRTATHQLRSVTRQQPAQASQVKSQKPLLRSSASRTDGGSRRPNVGAGRHTTYTEEPQPAVVFPSRATCYDFDGEASGCDGDPSLNTQAVTNVQSATHE
jgi:hypothetical protein